ncbi:MAG: F0F1 ATP synthase subunit delta [Gammaproteobacteria bacterium]|jgi:F-type H+-transporting ATPase subunit delta
MAEKTTIARPYAQAIFELAQSHQELPRWSEMLQLAATVAADARVAALLGNPSLDKAEVAKLFLDICGEQLTPAGQNLIRLLVENDRMDVLTEIAGLYEGYRAEAERTVEAQVISAVPVDAAQQQQIIAALKKRLGREVTLSCETDATLLGGAIIRAGDLVIDGSVTGQLAKLEVALAG